MLQLPTNAPVRRLSKSEIADITRVGKRVKKAVSVDPILRMIQKADAALIEYIHATNEKFAAEGKVERNDVFGPRVYPTDDLLNVYWSQGQQFSSEQHIERQFRIAAARLRAELKDCRSRLHRAKKMKGHNWENAKLELSQAIDSNERKLAKLKLALPRMKVAFRKEAKRISAIHRNAGLDKARDRARNATRGLDRATREMKDAKPRSLAGALAIMSYVQKRLGCGKARWFDDDEGYFPANCSLLLVRAHAVLEKALRNG